MTQSSSKRGLYSGSPGPQKILKREGSCLVSGGEGNPFHFLHPAQLPASSCTLRPSPSGSTASVRPLVGLVARQPAAEVALEIRTEDLGLGKGPRRCPQCRVLFHRRIFSGQERVCVCVGGGRLSPFLFPRTFHQSHHTLGPSPAQS